MRHEAKRKTHSMRYSAAYPTGAERIFLPGVTTIVIDVITVVVKNTPKCGRLAA